MSKDMQIEIFKRFSGEKRVLLGAELYEMVRQLIKDGMRNRHPELKDEQLDWRTKEVIAPWFKRRH